METNTDATQQHMLNKQLVGHRFTLTHHADGQTKMAGVINYSEPRIYLP